jgi:hypothetical protein
MTGKHEAVPLESEQSTQPSINCYKKKEDQKRTENPKINHQARISVHRPPSPIYHNPGRESMRNYKSELHSNCIPALVNGHINGIVSRRGGGGNIVLTKKRQWK